MWTCNICFKTFNRSTSYYNHRRSHKFNYEISSSEHESSSDEESSKEISSDQLFSKRDDVYNRNDGDDGEESNESDENTRIAFDDLSVPIIEHSVLATNINEMAIPIFSEDDDQTFSDDDQSDEQNFPNEIYRDFVKL